MSDNSHIQIQRLGKIFTNHGKETVAFKNISATVNEGEFVAILGPSGCGKSTLLRVLAGLEKPSNGSFHIRLKQDHAPNIAMVFQEHGLFPWMSLLRNIEFILENNPKLDQSQVAGISREYLSIVGLEQYADFYPHQVSGGMKQRVSIARSFASDPDILLMDEPFVFLDFQSRFLLHELLLNIWQGCQKTVLFVTHDIEEAVILADRILVFKAQPGEVIADDINPLPRPRDPLTIRKTPEFVQQVDKFIHYIRDDIHL